MAKSSTPLMFQPLARYADFNGRARRSEYWLWALFTFLLNIALMILQYGIAFSTMGTAHNATSANFGAMGAVLIISLLRFAVFLGLVVPTIAVAVRRMHDINRTGWWIIFPSVVGLIALAVVLSLNSTDLYRQFSQLSANSDGGEDAGIRAVIAAVEALLWVVLPTFAAKIVTFVFRVTEGTRGSNRYGPDPKNPAPTEVF